MKNSKIEWTDHTFNGWIGCAKVSPGCANCYAETLMDTRWGKVQWGKGKPRQRTSSANWKQPVKWNRDAAAQQAGWNAGISLSNTENELLDRGFIRPTSPRVFCSSLSDWLDDEVPVEWLADLLAMIHATPHLDWLMLTKRPENWGHRVNYAAAYLLAAKLPAGKWADQWATGTPPPNVWIGTTVENQQMADRRIPQLLSIPAKVRFLSCEPLLGPVSLHQQHPRPCDENCWLSRIDWIICGGESGPNARPMHPEWARSLRDQCELAGVPFLFKQWGEWHPATDDDAPKFIGVDGEFVNCPMQRIGKKLAGRLLDGREHNEFPTL